MCNGDEMHPQHHKEEGRARRLLSFALACGIAATAAACASSGAVPRPFPGSRVSGSPQTPARDAANPPPEAAPATTMAAPADSISLEGRRFDGRAVAEFALALRGVPYRFGGTDPAGFDCSGLVQYVFAQYGVAVPRVVEEQWQVGDKVKPAKIKPGDLLFFSTKGPGASHVAIAVDAEHFVHAPNSTGVVRVESLTSAYWGAHYIGAKRITSSTTTN